MSFSYSPPSDTSSVSSSSTITDWDDDTCTGSWTTNTTYICKTRRIGDSLEVMLRITLSGAPNAATSLSIDVPGGRTMDTDKIPTGGHIIGHGYGLDNGTAFRPSFWIIENGGQLQVFAQTAATAGLQVTPSVPHTWANTDQIYLRLTIPISGWTS
jgi:hypothetical protein